MLRAVQRIRVEWSHCDPARIIFNPHYYAWMDQGTHALLVAAGFDHARAVRDTPFRGCPLVTSGMEFFKPAYYRDILVHATEVERFGNKSYTVKHAFRRGDDILATGREVRVWGWTHPDDPEGLIAVPIPDDIRALLSRKGQVDTSP